MEKTYKEGILPESCPPASAQKREITLYRICKYSVPNDEDFVPYVRLLNEEKYINDCKAYGISFFDNYEIALQKFEKMKTKNVPFRENLKFIAKIRIKEAHGVIDNHANSPHYTLWLFKDAEIAGLEYIEVTEP